MAINPKVLEAMKKANEMLSKSNKGNKSVKGAIKTAKQCYDDLVIKRYPTPSDDINIALYGGIAVGKIIEIAGETGSGKSSFAMELIALNQKIAREEAIKEGKLDKDGNPDYDFQVGWFESEGCVSGDSEIFNPTTGETITAKELFETKKDFDVLSFNENTNKIEVKPITNYFNNGVKEVFEVATKTGTIKLTSNHKVLVHKCKDELEWKRVDELKVGDCVLRPRNIDINNTYCNDFNDEQLRFVGCMLGDGHCSASKVEFTNVDDILIEEFARCVKYLDSKLVRRNDVHFSVVNPNNSHGGNMLPNQALEFMKGVGLHCCVRTDKKIPQQMFKCSNEQLAQVLMGLFMTDGCVTDPKIRLTIDFSNISKQMINQTRHLLARFGIVGRVRVIHYKNPNHNTGYRVVIDGIDNLRKFNDNIPLISYKKDRLEQGLKKGIKIPYHSFGHYYPDYDYNLHRRKREMYINKTDCYFTAITSIKSVGLEETFDFTVQDNHNFFVNDILIHNSFDSEYAEKLGVDLERVTYWDQNDVAAEQGLDILVSFVNSGAFKMIILNSVSGLLPTAEKEASLAANQMCLQARLLSKLFRVVTAAANKNKCSLIFTNQFRQNMNAGMFGDPNIGTGGNALKYYSTQRIRMTKVKVQKEDPIKEKEGVKINIAILKNRAANMNDPYTKCVVYAKYGKGIDNIATLPDLLIDNGIVNQAGSWISYLENGEVVKFYDSPCKWQGKTRFADSLREYPELAQMFRNKLNEKFSGPSSLSEEEKNEIEEENKMIEEMMQEAESAVTD